MTDKSNRPPPPLGAFYARDRSLHPPAYAPGYAQAGADRPLQVNFNGPISVREEADLVRLAGMISELIGGKAVEYRRLNTGWATIS